MNNVCQKYVKSYSSKKKYVKHCANNGTNNCTANDNFEKRSQDINTSSMKRYVPKLSSKYHLQKDHKNNKKHDTLDIDPSQIKIDVDFDYKKMRKKIPSSDIIARYLDYDMEELKAATTDKVIQNKKNKKERKISTDLSLIADYENKRKRRLARKKNRSHAAMSADSLQKDKNQDLEDKVKWFRRAYNEQNNLDTSDQYRLIDSESNINVDLMEGRREIFMSSRDEFPAFSRNFDNMDRVNHEVVEIPTYHPELDDSLHEDSDDTHESHEETTKRSFWSMFMFWRIFTRKSKSKSKPKHESEYEMINEVKE